MITFLETTHIPQSDLGLDILYLRRFQTHLQRIAHFLSPGKEVWWENDEAGNVIFRDEDNDPEIHSEGPKILHFQNAYSVTTRVKRSWVEILQQEITIPLGAIRNFSIEGQSTVNIYTQPIESDSTSMITEDSTIDSEMDCSDASQVGLTESLNSESLLFSPTLVSGVGTT